MKRSGWIAIVLVAFACAVSTPAPKPLELPSTGTAMVTGRVSAGGAALPGATVILSNASGARRTTVSDSNGLYAFHAVPDGKYTVAFELAGMSRPFAPARACRRVYRKCLDNRAGGARERERAGRETKNLCSNRRFCRR
jgi:hypothetical protein